MAELPQIFMPESPQTLLVAQVYYQALLHQAQRAAAREALLTLRTKLKD